MVLSKGRLGPISKPGSARELVPTLTVVRPWQGEPRMRAPSTFALETGSLATRKFVRSLLDGEDDARRALEGSFEEVQVGVVGSACLFGAYEPKRGTLVDFT